MLSSIDRRMSASTSTERIALIRVASTPPSCSATSVGSSSGGSPAKGVRVDRVGDRAPQHERRPRLGGEQIDVVDDAEQLPPRREHRNVADPPVEHGQHQLGARLLGAGGERRRAHHLFDRRLQGAAGGNDP